MNQLWMAAFTYSASLILLSQAFYLMYRSTGIPNFALGSMSTVGAYSAYTIVEAYDFQVHLGYPVSFLSGAILSSIIVVILIEPMYRRGRSLVEMTLATMGLGILLEALIQILVYFLRSILPYYHSAAMLYSYVYKDNGVDTVFLISSILMFLSILFLRHFFKYMKTGLSIRATWDNLSLAEIQGVNPLFGRVLIWIIAGGLAGLGGGVMVMRFHVTPLMGSYIMTAVFASVILGGMGNMSGAVVGAILIGFVEILGTSYAQELIGVWIGEYRSIFTTSILIIVLLINPNGLFGVENTNKAGLAFFNRLNKKQWIIILSILAIGVFFFNLTCNYNRVQTQNEILQEFNELDLEVRDMDRSVTTFYADNVTAFKNMIDRLNVSKVYVETYNEKTTVLRFYFIRNNVYWRADVRLVYYGICQYKAR